MASSASSARASKSQAIDDLIMGTNNGSITSKRSVERFYHPNEPHFFRFFVSKFQRRAPLINRGYWLRLRAIDVIVRQFLTKPSTARKVVVNLGCGSDVLPWQCHTRYPDACKNALFVDTDYPDLIKKKRAIVLQTPELRELLGPDFSTSSSDADLLVLKSEKYCQIGCDLRQLDALSETLARVLDLSNCAVLFVAEVSVAYMDTLSADALIQWASSIGQAEFCLLEQLLPLGADHPYSQTMLSHFNKLKTPHKSVGVYPTCRSQQERFKNRGWHHVDVWDLWDAWTGDYFVSPSERTALDHVEAFDEWEEFMLFGRNYFVLHASVGQQDMPEIKPIQLVSSEADIALELKVTSYEAQKATKRRYGGAMLLTDPMGEQAAIHMMGMGSSVRIESCDVFGLGSQNATIELPLTAPRPRVCHTLTDLGDYGVLLAGGRGSPTAGLSDCWLFTRGVKPDWKAAPNLPVPLFRHSALKLKNSSLVLVAGGKMDGSNISESFFIFHPVKGWLVCDVSSTRPEPCFGVILCNSSDSNFTPGIYHGLLSGGICQTGILNTRAYFWTLDMTAPKPSLSFEELQPDSVLPNHLCSIGAQTVDFGTFTAICGGTSSDASIQGQTITLASITNGTKPQYTLTTVKLEGELANPPFMIGSSALALDKTLIILGGGATCYSMGTYWQTDMYSIDMSDVANQRPSSPMLPHSLSLEFLQSHKFTSRPKADTALAGILHQAELKPIPRLRLDSQDQFLEILRARTPVIIEGLDLGPCLQKWNSNYMVDRVGGDKEIVVHESLKDSEKLDFNSKNFRYVTMSFASVMNRVQAGDRLYLRSLSQAKPSESPASLEEDFPSLNADFCLPNVLAYVEQNKFSSVLRISGKVNMWLHYDVMANVYMQIQGSKRMILFPPEDVTKLSFAAGASSSSFDVFAALDTSSLVDITTPYEANLSPGDTLFLPPMWLHTAKPATPMSVAVNVFFRDLENGYSTGRDVYGNRDLAAYEKGRQDIARLAKAFKDLPPDIRRFYLARLADELEQATEGS